MHRAPAARVSPTRAGLAGYGKAMLFPTPAVRSLSALLVLSTVGCGGDRESVPSAPSVGPPAPVASTPQAGVPGPVQASTAEPRQVVVILIDTLRADVVAQVHTPQLDALAAQGLVVERAWSTTTWTVPAVISLFTGSFVRTHGWDLPTGDMTHRPPLPPLPTLAEVLHQAGFATRGLYANGYLAHELGFSRGFDDWRRSTDARMAEEVGRMVQGWRSDPQPQFLYLHLLGAHSGLEPSPGAQQRYQLDPAWFTERVGLLIGRAKRGKEPGVEHAYRQAYRAVVEDMDAHVGDILEALGPVRDTCLVVVLSDHGEELGEVDAFGHGWSVAEALTHVPVIVAGPGIEPGRRPTATIAELGDLITDTLGIDHPWPVQSPWRGPLVAERHGKQAVLVDGRWKGVWHGQELDTYDLVTDPGGLQRATGGRAQVEAALRDWRESTPAGEPLTEQVQLDPRTLEAVRALGYVD
jgi:hypothetical protein